MKKIIAITFALLTLTVCGFAQTSTKNDATIEAAMKKFVNSIETKKHRRFFKSYFAHKRFNYNEHNRSGRSGQCR